MKFKQSLERPSRRELYKKSELQTLLFIAAALIILTALYVPGWLNLRQVKSVPRVATQNYFPKKAQPAAKPPTLTIASLTDSNNQDPSAKTKAPAQTNSSSSVKAIKLQSVNDLLTSFFGKIRPVTLPPPNPSHIVKGRPN